MGVPAWFRYIRSKRPMRAGKLPPAVGQEQFEGREPVHDAAKNQGANGKGGVVGVKGNGAHAVFTSPGG